MTGDQPDDESQLVTLRKKVEGEPKTPSIIEGIGSGRLYANLEKAKIDQVVEVSDEEAIQMCHFILKHEGFLVGGSSGINLCSAVRAARALGPGKVIVSIMCDSGDKYLDQQFTEAGLSKLGLSKAMNLDTLSFLK